MSTGKSISASTEEAFCVNKEISLIFLLKLTPGAK